MCFTTANWAINNRWCLDDVSCSFADTADELLALSLVETWWHCKKFWNVTSKFWNEMSRRLHIRTKSILAANLWRELTISIQAGQSYFGLKFIGTIKDLGWDDLASNNKYIDLIFWLIPSAVEINAFRLSYTFWITSRLSYLKKCLWSQSLLISLRHWFKYRTKTAQQDERSWDALNRCVAKVNLDDVWRKPWDVCPVLDGLSSASIRPGDLLN